MISDLVGVKAVAQKFARFDDKQIRKFLNDVGKKIKNIRGADQRYVRRVAPIAQRDVNQHFEDEMGPSGKWQKWAPSTLLRYERIGKSGNNI